MKKFILGVICIITVCIMCYFITNTGSQNGNASQQDTTVTVPEAKEGMMYEAPLAKEFTYKGHQYIKFGSKSGVVHNPDCPCMNDSVRTSK